jgi:hypothetical protein
MDEPTPGQEEIAQALGYILAIIFFVFGIVHWIIEPPWVNYCQQETDRWGARLLKLLFCS